MAQRRPISSHPAFVPLAALWFAALLGLGVAVLPAPLLERALTAAGLEALVPLTLTGRALASSVAALLGALLGLVLALPIARRARDPRPIYAEIEPELEYAEPAIPSRRPLRVREELDEGIGGAPRPMATDGPDAVSEAPAPEEPVAEPETDTAPEMTCEPQPAAHIAEADEGFMILSPQPVHPPRPGPDLEALLAQFDTALATFRSGEEVLPAASSAHGEPDPVHAFVARQTGSPAPSALGGRMPDHQAELRAALDKLARAHRKD